MPLLSVIVPVYNEVKTIKEILEKIHALPLDKEIIVVDDGSSDGTDKLLRDIQFDDMKVIHHTSNRGKGAAFLTGLAHASGDFVIIQDADLEYDHADYYKLLELIQKGQADLVLGARFARGHTGLLFHRLGNKALTWFLNAIFGVNLNDYATCYKLASRQLWHDLNLRCLSFHIDVEIICNAIKKKKRILEVPIAYHQRSYKEGKKIRWHDGLWAIFHIMRYRFVD